MSANPEKWTKEEVYDKVDWEGGIHEAICGYGISPAVLPEDTPPDVIVAWTALYENDPTKVIARWLYDG